MAAVKIWQKLPLVSFCQLYPVAIGWIKHLCHTAWLTSIVNGPYRLINTAEIADRQHKVIPQLVHVLKARIKTKQICRFKN